ncbi:hypothetical protein [Streptomyces parvulus]|uniref:hypothetical protein n=1 Tax=Streptomyces parvulus TaxID=146923 RepID=UPI00380E4E8A
MDHLVPPAGAWDSGASTWSAKHREGYANDLGDPRTLVAATARSNQQKSDQDVAEWLPAEAVVCGCIAEWTAVKRRHHGRREVVIGGSWCRPWRVLVYVRSRHGRGGRGVQPR